MKRRGFLGKVAGGAVAGAAGVVSAQEKQPEAAVASGPLMKTPAVIMGRNEQHLIQAQRDP